MLLSLLVYGRALWAAGAIGDMRWVRDLFGALGTVIFAFLLALVSQDARAFVVQNPLVSAGVVVGCLVLTILFTLWRHEKIKFGSNSIPVKFEDIRSQTKIQFSDSGISESTEEIYERFFKNKHAMDDDEYAKIEDRGKFIRAAIKSYEGKVDRSVVGYYSIFPISLKTFEDMRTGAVRESSLTNDMVLDPHDPGAELLYICEICSIDDHSAVKLIYDMKKYIRKMIMENSNISEIGAWGFSKEGRRLVELMGMKRVKSFNSRKPFYKISVKSALSKL